MLWGSTPAEWDGSWRATQTDKNAAHQTTLPKIHHPDGTQNHIYGNAAVPQSCTSISTRTSQSVTLGPARVPGEEAGMQGSVEEAQTCTDPVLQWDKAVHGGARFGDHQLHPLWNEGQGRHDAENLGKAPVLTTTTINSHGAARSTPGTKFGLCLHNPPPAPASSMGVHHQQARPRSHPSSIGGWTALGQPANQQCVYQSF